MQEAADPFFCTSPCDDEPQTISPLGTNLTVVADWSTEYPFINAFKTSRDWITHSEQYWDTGEQEHLDLDKDGWVKSLPEGNTWEQYRSVGTLLFTQLEGNYPSGDYTILYDGDGELQYGLDATYVATRSIPGRHIINVDSDKMGNGIHLEIIRTNPANYIRNIRVIPPGYNPDRVSSLEFHPDFLDSIKSYGTLRFMDWQRTNWSLNGEVLRAPQPSKTMHHPMDDPTFDPTVRTGNWTQFEGWTGRAVPDNARYSLETGMPLEIMVDLANINNSNPWFTVPHLADNTYVWQMASLVKAQLRTDRYVYIEYTNEAWNEGFGQGAWIQQKGLETWGWGTNPGLARWQWYGKRSAEICNIWKQTWEADAHRVICVMASQAANPYIAQQMLDCPLMAPQNCYQNIDAIAIAPYLGQHLGNPIYQSEVLGWTWATDGGMTSLFNELRYGNVLPNVTAKTNVNDAIANVEAYSQIAKQYGLMLVAYEGGQHITANGSMRDQPRIIDMFEQANRDWRMGQIYADYLNAWRQAGGLTFAHYVNTGGWNQWGAWGAQEFYNSPNAFKRSALVTYAEQTRCEWIGCLTSSKPVVWLPMVLNE